MTDEIRRAHYITAKEFPVAIAMDDVTYTEALKVAGFCLSVGQLLSGPDDGPDGYVVSFGMVAGVKITARPPSGPAMIMPATLISELLAEADEDDVHVPDDAKGDRRG